ncbi:MAG: hypothetical protein AAB150_03165, partial [Pseudomonadota bacterium]
SAAILDRGKLKPLLGFIHHRVFVTDTLFIHNKKHGGRAQRAMSAPHYCPPWKNISSCGVRTCAAGAPAARIADCVRMKSTSAGNRRSCMESRTVFAVL